MEPQTTPNRGENVDPNYQEASKSSCHFTPLLSSQSTTYTNKKPLSYPLTPFAPIHPPFTPNPTTVISKSKNNVKRGNNNVYNTPQTPISGSVLQSPFNSKFLTPIHSSKPLFALNTPDQWPQQSSTVDKNVHSPPRVSIPVNELKEICEMKFKMLNIETIKMIKMETRCIKYLIREWFRKNWFLDNHEIPKVQIIRTVYSLFCKLKKESKLHSDIIEAFEDLWKSKVNIREGKVPHMKKRKNDQNPVFIHPLPFETSDLTIVSNEMFTMFE